jgi:polyhydroxyalkanoate synthesis regulator phasin
MEKRYQVFVSSTYLDLVDERAEIMQALLELDCMPAGMELFPAANDEQWSWIKKVIKESDYYIVVIGGRYGSISESTGLSYTEMEYRYAVEIGIPVIGFIHENPSAIPFGKTEKDNDSQLKLAEFKTFVQRKLCKSYSNSADLGAKVSRSLTQLIKQYPTPGWVRANYLSEDTAKEILALRKQIEDLQEKLRRAGSEEPSGIDELAKGEDSFEIHFVFETKLPRTGKNKSSYWVKGEEHPDKIITTWNEIFITIAPDLIVTQNHWYIQEKINSFLFTKISKRIEKAFPGQRLDKVSIVSKDYDLIIVQLRALKLINCTDEGLDWILTPYGDSYIVVPNLRTIV